MKGIVKGSVFFIVYLCIMTYIAGLNGNVIQASADKTTSSEEILLYKDTKIKLDNDGYQLNSNDIATINRNGMLYAVKSGITDISGPDTSSGITVVEKQKPRRSIYSIVVYKATQSVVVYAPDFKGEYKVPVRVMTCSTGEDGENDTKTGEYKVRAHYRWRLLYGPCYGQYSTAISPSYLFHSLPYEKKSPDTVYDYEKLGTKSSHGCIRLSVRDAKWIYENCDLGSFVTITNSSGLKGAPPVPEVKDERYKGWDPTDDDINSPYVIDGIFSEPVLNVSTKKLDLNRGETVRVDIQSTDAQITANSTNASVAVCDESGYVTAYSPGVCTIFLFSAGGASCSFDIQVN